MEKSYIILIIVLLVLGGAAAFLNYMQTPEGDLEDRCPDSKEVNCMPPVSERGYPEYENPCIEPYHSWIKENCDTEFAY